MDSREFEHWIQYDRIDPIGAERDDFRTAQILEMMYSINKKKGAPKLSAKDFVPKFGEDVDSKPQQSVASMKATLLGTPGPS